MSELLEIVRYDELKQPVSIAPLEFRDMIMKERDSLTITPGGREVTMVARDTRRGGQRQNSERRTPGSLSALWMVKGKDPQQAVQRMEDLLALGENADVDRYIYWRPDGVPTATMFPIVGTATAQVVNYRWAPFVQRGYLMVQVTWPIEPEAEGLCQDAADDWRPRAPDDPLGVVNEVLNPRATNNGQNWQPSAPSQYTVTGNPTASWTTQVSGSPLFGIVANIAAPGSTNIDVWNARDASTGQPDFAMGKCKAGDTVFARASVRNQAVAGTTMGQVHIRLIWYLQDGASTTVVVNTVTAPAVLGTVELSGSVVAPAGAIRYRVGIRASYNAVPTSFTWYFTKVMAVTNPPVSDPTPAFFDVFTGDARPEPRNTTSLALCTHVRTLRATQDVYTYPFGEPAFPVASTAMLLFPGNITGQNALMVDKTRQPWRVGQVTVKVTMPATARDYVGTPGLGYDDDGHCYFVAFAGGQLTIQERRGTGATIRGQTPQALPAANATYWLRIKRSATGVTAEYWATEPTPYSSPTLSFTWLFASFDTIRDRPGYPVVNAYAPAAANPFTVVSYSAEPYTFTLVNTPAAIDIEELPGGEEAGCDVTLDFVFDDNDPVPGRHLAVGWRRKKAPAAGAGFTEQSLLIWGENYIATGGLDGGNGGTIVSDAALRNGQGARAAVTANDAGTYWEWNLDSAAFEPDDFSDQAIFHVLARYRRNGTLVQIPSPRLIAALAYTEDTANYPLSYTPEFGQTGRFLSNLLGITSTYLGSLAAPLNAPDRRMRLRVSLRYGSGGTAGTTFDLDELYLLPARSHIIMPTGRSRDDGTYPLLVNAVGQTRRIHPDRRAYLGPHTPAGAIDQRPAPLALGGSDLRFPSDPLGCEMVFRPSVGVPDDPSATAVNDVLTHYTTVHLGVTPRYSLLAA